VGKEKKKKKKKEENLVDWLLFSTPHAPLKKNTRTHAHARRGRFAMLCDGGAFKKGNGDV
jgi:hypothetical protein